MQTARAVSIGLIGTIVSLLVLGVGLSTTSRPYGLSHPGLGAAAILAAGLLLGGVLFAGRSSWWAPSSSGGLLLLCSLYAFVQPFGLIGVSNGLAIFFAYQLCPLLSAVMLMGSIAFRGAAVRSRESPRPHPAYDITVGSSKETLVRRLGEPTGGRPSTVGLRNEEYWLYTDTPSGHDTRIVVSARGVVESLEVVPHEGNRIGRARHVISPPDRRQPMAAAWATDRESVLGNQSATAHALAEFAETFEIENAEHDLTESQKSRRYDRSRLDEGLDDEAMQPAWMLTPLAIRRIGRELDRRGGFSTMQNTYYQAREIARSPGRVTIVELLWDRIGRWER